MTKCIDLRRDLRWLDAEVARDCRQVDITTGTAYEREDALPGHSFTTGKQRRVCLVGSRRVVSHRPPIFPFAPVVRRCALLCGPTGGPLDLVSPA